MNSNPNIVSPESVSSEKKAIRLNTVGADYVMENGTAREGDGE